jgi:probable HAF family extracellular repeat protein/VCBS repeat-containing protein
MAKKNGVTFSNSHAASADVFSESDSEAKIVQTYNLLTQDPASAVLFSIGSSNTTMTTVVGNVSVPTDLMTEDAVGYQIETTLGATVTILNGTQVRYDATAIAPTVIDKLAAGQTATDSFLYAIEIGNGTVAWNTVTIALAGQAAKITATDNGVQEDVNVNASGNLADSVHVSAFAASGNQTTFTITPAAGNLGSLSALTGSGNAGLTYSVSNVAVYNTHLGFGEYTRDSFTVTTANGTTLGFTETIEGNIHAASLTATAGQASLEAGQSTRLYIAATDHDDNASLTYRIAGVPADATLTSAAHQSAIQYDAQTHTYAVGAAALGDLTYTSGAAGPVALAVAVINTESDGTRTVTASATATISISALPTVTTPTITGIAQEDQTLTAHAAAGDSDDTISFQWARDGSDITGATGSTYVVREADEGHRLSVVATVTNDDGLTASAASTATATVVDVPPTLTTPTISGTAQLGSTLTATAAVANDADATVTYQWQSRHASDFAYTALVEPAAASPGGVTYGFGLNDSGQIVGTYGDASGGRHGFLYGGGTYTTLDNPLAPTFTYATGINNAGQIVGIYNDGVRDHGYLYSDGTWATLDDPSAIPLPSSGFTDVTGINDAGDIVGVYGNAGGSHGFLYSGGIWTTFDDPSALPGTTAVTGINDVGQMVGTFADASGTHGFLYSGGTWTTLDDPSATTQTQAQGIDDAGQIVGTYRDGSGQHGFLYGDGAYTAINDPSAPNYTIGQGINDAGQVIGTAAGGAHAFLATPSWTDLAGETGLSHVVTEADQGGQLRLVATSTDSDGNGTTAASPVEAVSDVFDFGLSANSTLVLANSVAFNGTIAGFAQPDQIDLADIAYGPATTLGYAGTPSNGTLTVSDGTNIANLALIGQYVLGNFNLSADSHGGTLVTDPPASVGDRPVLAPHL